MLRGYRTILTSTLLTVVAFLIFTDHTEAGPVKLYQEAPKFEALDDTGTLWKSSDHVGKKNIVVYFYPADLTPGCTKQACGYRDARDALARHNVEVVGISGDSVENHQLFKKVHNLNFTLLADKDGSIARKFGVPVGEGGSIEKEVDGKDETLTRGVTTGRWTFLIQKDGRIGWRNEKVNAPEDPARVLAVIEEIKSLSEGGEPSWWDLDLPRQPGAQWTMHDPDRPLPRVIQPGKTAASAPADAIVLFDGKNLDQWQSANGDAPARWTVRDGYAELNHTGSIKTRQGFGDCQFHIEWRAPSPPKKRGQARGNSGIFFMQRYEVQIVDSYENTTYADGSAASLYGMSPPLVNACRSPGEWQTYDIIFRAPRFRDGEVLEKARATVFHNGVLVHYDEAFTGKTAWRTLPVYTPHSDSAPIEIQDHGDRQGVRYRNIWVRPLDFAANK